MNMRRVGWGLVCMCLAAAPAMAGGDIAVFGSYLNSDQATDNGALIINPATGQRSTVSTDNWGGGVKFRWEVLELRTAYFNDIESNRLVFNCTDPLCNGNRFKVRMIPVEAGLAFKFLQNESVSPYIGGGAGYYFLRGNNDNPSLVVNDSGVFRLRDEWGWYGVLGTDFTLPNGVGLMLEATYRRVKGTVRNNTNDTITDLNRQVNLQLGGVGANVGVVFHLF